MKQKFECYEILRAGNRFDCGEQCEECKTEQNIKEFKMDVNLAPNSVQNDAVSDTTGDDR